MAGRPLVPPGPPGPDPSRPARRAPGRGWRSAAAAALLVALAAIDLSRPPARQAAARIALVGIAAYQATLAPLHARLGVACRFTPTCSHYAAACLRDHGLLRGGWLALHRVARCGPWTPAGTVDPPPEPGARHAPAADDRWPAGAAAAAR